MKIKRLLPLVIFLFASLLMKAGTPKIAYIYAHDMTRATEYQAFLTTKGYDVSLFDTNQLGTINFADFSLIMIGEKQRLSEQMGRSFETITNNRLRFANFRPGRRRLCVFWNTKPEHRLGIGKPFCRYICLYSFARTSDFYFSEFTFNSIGFYSGSLYNFNKLCCFLSFFHPAMQFPLQHSAPAAGRCVLVQQTSKYFPLGF